MAEKRPVENHKEEVPFSHYVDLFRALDPQEAAERPGAAFDRRGLHPPPGGCGLPALLAGIPHRSPGGGLRAPKSPGTDLPAPVFAGGPCSTGSGHLQDLPGNALGRTLHPALHRPVPDPGGLHLRHEGSRNFPPPWKSWAPKSSRTATPAMPFPCCRASPWSFWSGPGTRSFPPARRFSTPTILRPGFAPEDRVWWPATC